MGNKLIFYHGTSEANAKKILAEGFKVEGVKRNWKIIPKTGLCYFSLAYAIFYAMNGDNKEKEQKIAIIKVAIDEDDLYPEDDFIMYAMGKPKYTQEELDAVDFEKIKHLWKKSVIYMGNVSAKPDKVKVLGVTYFYGRQLQYFCDPVITPLNFKYMGDYYRKMTEWIFEGKDIKEFPHFMES
jgi:hypothetical protein